MARKPGAAQQIYEELLSRHETAVAKAFADSIANITDAAELSRVVRALEARDIDAALSALHLEASAYAPLREALRAGYLDGGAYAADQMPAKKPDGARLVMRFDIGNPVAAAWIDNYSANLITRIADDQRVAIRVTLTEGMAQGVNPRSTALEIVGRINRATGKREGGLLGLSAPQEVYARTAKAELASSDPALLRNYLTRARRDRRFDRTILKAIADKKAPPADIAAKALGQYRNRLLKLRGEVIGQKESFGALAGGKEQAYRQAIDKGEVEAADVTKTWRHFNNKDPRHDHEAMQGKVVGINESFILPDGTAMAYPHDPAAPIKHTAGCHCQADYKIDFFARLRRQ